ncbi:MAG TPA: LapA family protein [Candidatus Competibacteraceae bacterium]|nr:LapA family protein [Candidatus Competibacteraceae bacterium]
MSWIKYGLSSIVLLAVLVVGLEFAVVNSEPVAVNYFLGSATLPLALVLVAAFTAGVVVTALISLLLIVLPLRWRLGRLQRTLHTQQGELAALRRKLQPDSQQA